MLHSCVCVCMCAGVRVCCVCVRVCCVRKYLCVRVCVRVCVCVSVFFILCTRVRPECACLRGITLQRRRRRVSVGRRFSRQHAEGGSALDRWVSVSELGVCSRSLALSMPLSRSLGLSLSVSLAVSLRPLWLGLVPVGSTRPMSTKHPNYSTPWQSSPAAPRHATPAASLAQRLGSVQLFILILPHFVFGMLIAETFFSSQRKSFPVG